jgi:hypothetical protein
VLTPDSVDSRWVQEEVRMAMHQGISGRKASVLPVLRKDCQPMPSGCGLCAVSSTTGPPRETGSW